MVGRNESDWTIFSVWFNGMLINVNDNFSADLLIQRNQIDL